jgi:hypothetical protein
MSSIAIPTKQQSTNASPASPPSLLPVALAVCSLPVVTVVVIVRLTCSLWNGCLVYTAQSKPYAAPKESDIGE